MMSKFTNSIGSRLSLGFGALLVLLVLVAGFSAITTLRLGGQVHEIVDVNNERSSRAYQMLDSMNAMAIQARSITLLTDAKEIESELKAFEKSKAAYLKFEKDLVGMMASADPAAKKLTDDIAADNYNYGQLQIRFEDGSVGWYEAGWGPMISETAFFVKDVFGPKGSVSIVAKDAGATGKSDHVDSHTKTESIRVHHADIDDKNLFLKKDEWIDMTDEPDHQELCNREQQYFLRAIQEDIDLTDHLNDTLNSLRIAFACDESVKTGEVVKL